MKPLVVPIDHRSGTSLQDILKIFYFYLYDPYLVIFIFNYRPFDAFTCELQALSIALCLNRAII